MKKYIIDNQLVYNTEDRSLARIGDELASVVLTHIAARLLTLLLESRGELVLRDTILQQVWDDHDLTSSNNNLNHYVSNLRKQFATLGLEKALIITEPKQGFRLNSDVIIEQQPIEGIPLALAKPEIVSQLPEVHDKGVGKQPGLRHLPKKSIATAILCILSVIIGYRFITLEQMTQRDIRGIQHILNEGGCPIYTTERNFSPGHIQYDRTILGRILAEGNITCDKGDIIIAYFSGFFEKDKYNGQAFVAKCHLKGDTVLSCHNRYIYSVKKNEE